MLNDDKDTKHTQKSSMLLMKAVWQSDSGPSVVELQSCLLRRNQRHRSLGRGRRRSPYVISLLSATGTVVCIDPVWDPIGLSIEVGYHISIEEGRWRKNISRIH